MDREKLESAFAFSQLARSFRNKLVARLRQRLRRLHWSMTAKKIADRRPGLPERPQATTLDMVALPGAVPCRGAFPYRAGLVALVPA